MKVKILASGSSGNSTYLELENKKILIDCGISRKKIEDSLQKIAVGLDEIDYMLITHEHIDHISGLVMTVKKGKMQVFLTQGTYNYLLNNPKYSSFLEVYQNRFSVLGRINDTYETLNFDPLLITPIIAFHDANEPVGYFFIGENKKVVYLTDTGYVHQKVMPLIGNADVYIWETNHEPSILMASERPYPLKMRILSDQGHLSNADSLFALANLVGPRTQYVFYAHVSAECNLREIIDMTRVKIFNKLGVDTSKINFIHAMPYDIKEIEL